MSISFPVAALTILGIVVTVLGLFAAGDIRVAAIDWSRSSARVSWKRSGGDAPDTSGRWSSRPGTWWRRQLGGR